MNSSLREMTAADGRPWMRPLGSTGISTSALIAGASPLGTMEWAYGYAVSRSDALDLLKAVFDSPIRSVDVARMYSDGTTEEWIGAAIEHRGGLDSDFAVFTKVDPTGMEYTDDGVSAQNADYSAERVRTSLAESEAALGLTRLPLVHLHDPEWHDFADITSPGGPLHELIELKKRGRIGAVGLAMGNVPEAMRYLELGVFDAFLCHNRWSLVDRSAEPAIDLAFSQGIAYMNAAVFGGGLLSNPHGARTTYGYLPASAELLEATRRMAAICADHGTDLATAALQFSVRDPRVTATVVGFTKKERIDRSIAAATAALPEELWDSLEREVPTSNTWLDPR